MLPDERKKNACHTLCNQHELVEICLNERIKSSIILFQIFQSMILIMTLKVLIGGQINVCMLPAMLTYCQFSCDVIIFQNKKLPILLKF